jgi:hypothetical protein
MDIEELKVADIALLEQKTARGIKNGSISNSREHYGKKKKLASVNDDLSLQSFRLATQNSQGHGS